MRRGIRSPYRRRHHANSYAKQSILILSRKNKREQNFSKKGDEMENTALLPTVAISLSSQGGDDAVQSGTWVHGCISLCLVDPVVSTEIHGRSLTFDQLVQDGRLLLP